MRTLGRALFAVFPIIALTAIVLYVWPRSDPGPRQGAIIWAFRPRLLLIPVGALIVHWISYLLILLVSERRATRRLWIFIVGAIALALVFAVLLMLPRNTFLATMLLSLPAALTIVLLLGWKREKQFWMYGAGITPLVGSVCPYLLVIFVFWSHPWNDAAQLRLPDGRIFHVQRFWESDILTQEISNDFLFLRTKVIVGNYNEYAGLAIVRPEGAAYNWNKPKNRYSTGKSTGKLVSSTDGKFIAFIFPYDSYPNNKVGCATNLAYNLRTGQRWGAEKTNEIYDFSPFALVGPTDKININDVEAMTEGDGAWVSSCQNKEVIKGLRRSENPWIRVAVARWQKTLPRDAPNLRKSLQWEAEWHPDPAQCAAAREALVWLKGLTSD